MTKQPETRKTDQPLALSSSAVLGPNTQLVERLREWASEPACYEVPPPSLLLDAANEIDRLNAWAVAYYKAMRAAILAERYAERGLMLRLVAGIDHLDKLTREREPDHSSGADRRGWLLAKDARDDAVRALGPNAANDRAATAQPARP